jgi:DnaK suppressor protein
MTHGRPGPDRYDPIVDGSGAQAPMTDAAGEPQSAVEAQSRGLAGSEFGVLDGIEAELADVQSALERLDDGSYGLCEQCGAQIDEEILESSPAARFCGSHLPFRQVP